MAKEKSFFRVIIVDENNTWVASYGSEHFGHRITFSQAIDWYMAESKKPNAYKTGKFGFKKGRIYFLYGIESIKGEMQIEVKNVKRTK